jgi:hypothetical protein
MMRETRCPSDGSKRGFIANVPTYYLYIQHQALTSSIADQHFRFTEPRESVRGGRNQPGFISKYIRGRHFVEANDFINHFECVYN